MFCPVCGSSAVAKLPSAPYVNLPRTEPEKETAVTGGPDFMAKLRAKVIEYALKHTEDVGERFPEEARQIHNGEAPERFRRPGFQAGGRGAARRGYRSRRAPRGARAARAPALTS